MSALPKVVSPLVTVGEREGVELILVSVEAWPDEVVIRMRGRPSPSTQRMEDEFDAALEGWHRDGREGQIPEQPGTRIFGLDLAVADDLGTEYRLRSASRGGSGRMFRADWTFGPGPPRAANRLAVKVGDGPETEVRLT
jgi:hypothetical protein